jgi:hypothetical protein
MPFTLLLFIVLQEIILILMVRNRLRLTKFTISGSSVKFCLHNYEGQKKAPSPFTQDKQPRSFSGTKAHLDWSIHATDEVIENLFSKNSFNDASLPGHQHYTEELPP